MEDFLRFTGAATHDPAVAAWFADASQPLRRMVQPWFEQMRRSGAGVLELLHDGCPVACVDDAPFAYVNAFKAHASVGFFHGAALADPAGLLAGTGKRMRHVKLRPADDVDDAALAKLIAGAYRDICARLGRTS